MNSFLISNTMAPLTDSTTYPPNTLVPEIYEREEIVGPVNDGEFMKGWRHYEYHHDGERIAKWENYVH
jgi:hypothetical protein